MDELRLAVTELTDGMVGWQVEIYVNEVEMTRAGAGLGMDPYDVLVPTNRFAAGTEPATVPAARCTCGEYGCGTTDITIVEDGDLVHWDWSGDTPMERRATFPAGAYRQEVERVAADHGWETPDRTAGRLVLETVDPARLPEGITLDWVASAWRDPGRFLVSLTDHGRQVIVPFVWADRTPEELADEIRRTLHEVPRRDWRA
jgi:hypothetical protein